MIITVQALGIALTLAFGVLAALVWRRLGADRWRKPQAGWLVTGGCFVPIGLFGVVHTVAGSAAMNAGTGSQLYRTFMEWSPAGNIGRSAGVAAYALMLAALMASPPRRVRPVAAASLWIIMGATVGGTAAAARYGAMSFHTQMTMVAVFSTVIVLALLVALLLGVMNDGMDLLLWMAVAAYTLKETVIVSVLAILAWWETARGIEAPLLFVGSNFLAMMLASVLAWVRLRRAVEQRHVPALFERLHALRRPAES